jgi:hypothetical protein
MDKIFLIWASFFFMVGIANAQEICNDGIDNDGDGFIDCFDSDCSSNADCDGFYLGNDASCEAEPSQFPVFTLSLGYKSPDFVVNHLGRIAIGDLDRDGIPEIFTQSRYTNRIYALNGTDASIKEEAVISDPQWRMSIVNLEDDNCGEVFVVSRESGSFRIVSLDCNLNELWKSENLKGDPVHLGYADFDRDGQPEAYYRDEIRDPITGIRLVASTANWNDIGGGPVAVDIVGDEDLELVLNNRIYRVNLGARGADAGSLTLLATMPEAFRVKRNGGENSTTSVADYNLDGFLDVITTGADNNGITTVYYWDVFNNTVRTFSDRINENNYRNGWKNGTGRINIGDLDGNGQLNAVFVSGKYLYCLDENWNLLWKVIVNEETSGYTGCTLFDFNGDAKMEVVYRDEDYLYIVNGTDGSIGTSIHCRSRTSVEYPIVADVDADGSTEICVLCAPENFQSAKPGRDLALNTPGEVRVYKSGGEPWVPARRLWNQHGYFNVNINDDLTVPRTQQKHQLVWSTGTCSAGAARPLNGFLNQSPFLNSSGCPTYASPDLAIVDNSFSIKQPDCPENDFTISFEFENIGDVPLSGSVPITLYDGDPLVAGTNKLNTEFITLNNFTVGQTGAAVDIPVSGSGGPFTLYAVLNDNGSSVPTPITLPNTNFLECGYVNNIVFAEVNPIPFNLSAEKTNNITCSGGNIPSNGSARVFAIVDGFDETADNDFYWFDGTDVSGLPDYIGSIYSGLSAGTYTVYASHKLAKCTSDTLQVVIEDSIKIITAEIAIDRGNSRCRNPNGRLTVAVNGGDPVGNYTYEWYVGNSVGGGLVIGTSHTVNSLESGSYTILVTDKATGCQTIESEEVPDETETPVLTALAVDIFCSDQNSGSVSATVEGVTAGFTFEWFIGPSEKPTADFTGSDVNNLPAGDYTVIVTDNSTACKSIPIPITIGQTLAPTINGVSSTNNTSCDNSLPNGSVTVTIAGDPAEHTIEWFAGATTTTAVISNDATVNGLGAGEYTIKLLANATGCFVTDKVSILNNIVKPIASLIAEPVTRCSPFNGRISATVDLDSESDYTFSWYSGTQVKAATDFSETGNILDALEPGFYTVQAFNDIRNCIADAKTIEVIDQATIAITQNDNVIELPSDCNDDSGILEVTVNSVSNISGFTLEWYEGAIPSGTPFFTETGVTTSRAENLSSGIYTVVATDLDNGCSNDKIFNLPYEDSHILVTESVVNATTCNPNDDGAITVSLTLPVLAGFVESNYDLRVYSNNDLTTAPTDSQLGVIGTSIYVFTGLSNGSYTIEALSLSDNCPVYSFAEITLESTDPVVNELISTPNINCSVAAATGTIEIAIDGGLDPSLYSINWYEGNDIAAPILGTTTGSAAGINGEIAENLIGGNYTVEVINIITQCSTTATYGINDNPTIVTINASDLLVASITRCDVINSEATVLNIYENGTTANLGDYTFEWLDQAEDLLPNATSPNTTNTIAGLDVGTYFVRVTNTITGCFSSLTEFEIENEVVPPTITLDFQNPERCAIPSLGELHVNASGGATYSYNWYIGASTTGAVAETGPDYIGLSEGIYTVEIIDNSSNCVYTETYELVNEINELVIIASATPVTSCDSDDGTVFATITSPGNYTYTWRDSNGTIVGMGKEVTSLSLGEYTVVAVDDNDSFCQNTATVSITNEQQIPVLALEQIAPLTVCDLTRANGAARALVDGGFIGYTFEWFEGSSATGNVVFEGPEFSQMKDILYTVRATNNISQCSALQSIDISSEIQVVPNPTIDAIANDTHCDIDNGILSATVNGGSGSFTYNWYIGEQITNTPDFVGERVINLPAGRYTVTAINLTTGCASLPVTAELQEDLQYPEFEFTIKGVNCNEANGFASVIMTNDVEISKIEWTDANGTLIKVGPNLSEVFAGVYTVYIETAVGCFSEQEITIPTEVNPFNGISRNGDGRNSFFKIDCITNFPNNVVKIYNRAGTLVYEEQGYDNSTKMFDGISNKGINIMGTNVPDGTYFYVVDKNDGSKPLTGYLEIVN